MSINNLGIEKRLAEIAASVGFSKTTVRKVLTGVYSDANYSGGSIRHQIMSALGGKENFDRLTAQLH